MSTLGNESKSRLSRSHWVQSVSTPSVQRHNSVVAVSVVDESEVVVVVVVVSGAEAEVVDDSVVRVAVIVAIRSIDTNLSYYLRKFGLVRYRVPNLVGL